MSKKLSKAEKKTLAVILESLEKLAAEGYLRWLRPYQWTVQEDHAMTPMRINLMPKPERPETLERSRNAQVGAYKLLVYRLLKENEAQRKVIEMYSKYFHFMERRYPVEPR